MAVAFRIAGALADNATTTTLPIVAPTTNVATDDIFVAVILGKDNQTITVPDGTWTKFVEVNNTANQRMTLAWKRVVPGDAGATFNFTKPTDNNILFCGVILCFSGCLTTATPIDATTPTTSANASSDTVTYADFNPAETAAFVVAVGGYNNDLTTAGAISGTDPAFTNRLDVETNLGTDASIFAYTGSSSGAATGARSHSTTSTVDDVNLGILFGLKAAPLLGVASISAAATVAALAVATWTAAAALAASAAVASVAVATLAGAVALTASATTAANGLATWAATAALTASVVLAPAPTADYSASAAPSASATVAPVGTATYTAAATLPGSAALVAAAGVERQGVAALAAAAALAANATADYSAAAVTQGSATVGTAGTIERLGAATLSASASIEAVGTNIEGVPGPTGGGTLLALWGCLDDPGITSPDFSGSAPPAVEYRIKPANPWTGIPSAPPSEVAAIVGSREGLSSCGSPYIAMATDLKPDAGFIIRFGETPGTLYMALVVSVNHTPTQLTSGAERQILYSFHNAGPSGREIANIAIDPQMRLSVAADGHSTLTSPSPIEVGRAYFVELVAEYGAFPPPAADPKAIALFIDGVAVAAIQDPGTSLAGIGGPSHPARIMLFGGRDGLTRAPATISFADFFLVSSYLDQSTRIQWLFQEANGATVAAYVFSGNGSSPAGYDSNYDNGFHVPTGDFALRGLWHSPADEGLPVLWGAVPGSSPLSCLKWGAPTGYGNRPRPTGAFTPQPPAASSYTPLARP